MENNNQPALRVGRLLDQGETVYVDRPVFFQAKVDFSELPETALSNNLSGTTTPNALNVTKIRLNSTVATDVTNFLNGQEGQTIFVVGDGSSTIKNNSTILTNTGSDKLTEDGLVYSFTLVEGKWRELAGAGSVGPTAPPPQTLTFTCGELHTGAAFGVYQEYPSDTIFYRLVCSLSDFTEFRIYYVIRDVAGNPNLQLQYSLNGTAWVAFWTSGTISVAGQALSAYAAIPAGAIAATVYFRIMVRSLSVSNPTARLTSFQVQVK